MKQVPAFVPLLFLLVLGAAVLALNQGAIPLFQDEEPEDAPMTLDDAADKVREAMDYVNQQYFREPDNAKMAEDAVVGMLEGLDPHTFYIPAKDMKAVEESMSGSFEGIGVQFNILDDTIYVVAPITGGPSEKLGIQAGDRIVEIEGETVAGVGITNNDVVSTLRGPKGTEVRVGIHRRGVDRTLYFTIVRDEIPIHSVDFAYMINAKTGYIKVNRFAENTFKEFNESLHKLRAQGLENLVLDLRSNPGGYLNQAYMMADMFLKNDQMIVYTDGRIPQSKQEYKATNAISGFEKGGVVVLIDQGSASASEIVSGSIQDWDRGIIVGVRSFGKGLVQTQHRLKDGSAIRVVVSRYFTPSGRCIQKPFDKTSEEYQHELLDRFESGELYDEDKVNLPDSLKFKTPMGRTVYGGGGIMPDYFVPRDTTQNSDYLTSLFINGVFTKFGYQYPDAYPEAKGAYPTAASFVARFEVDRKLMDDFKTFAEENEVEYDKDGFKASEAWIKARIKASIGRVLYGEEGYYPVIHQLDDNVQKALEVMPKAEKLARGINPGNGE